jgi:hypothetical protein
MKTNSSSIGSGSAERRFGGQGGAGRVASGRRHATATAANAARPKDHGQVKSIFAEAKKRALDGETLRDLVADVTRRTRSIADLTHAEADRVIRRLKGRDYTPLRTMQHRRAKTGVSQIVTDDQLTKIAALATQRKWSAQTLVNFCIRQCGHPVRTTVDANKVIEALKAMNKREGLWAA